MWKNFLNKIGDDNDHQALFIAQAQEIDKYFKFNLDKLITACEDYYANCALINESDDINSRTDKLQKEWLELGKVQKKYLPMHFLKELCFAENWDP